MDIKEFAKQVADKIRHPSQWASGSSAKDARGFHTHPRDPSAVRWCALGAADAIDISMSVLLNIAFRTKYNRSISFTNDKLGHEAIIRDLDNL